MSFDRFARLMRALFARSGPRRAVIAAIATALLGVTAPADARKTTRRKPTGRKNKRDRNRDRKRTGKKGSGKSSSGGCTNRYSEQEILGFIKKAAKKYNQSSQAMERVARCESNLDPCAVNRSGPYYGLFQFLKSTWKTTPYGNRDIFDPEAQALATAWMWNEGRKNEWACQ
jgi:hypothetical protein